MRHCFAAALLLALSALAQDAPEFEVASVKASKADMPAALAMMPMNTSFGFSGGPGSKDPGRINYTGVTLKALLARAYDMKPYQIFGPAWLDTERCDVVAKLPPETDNEKLRVMLRRLVSERFRLQAHPETRPLRAYTLTVAKNGPKLQAPQDQPQYKDQAEQMDALRKQLQANMAARAADGFTGPSRSMGMANATISKFADALERYLDGPVIDQTGIEGAYSFKLAWNPDTTSSGPTIFSALQEQLGLKLEPGKNPIEVLVVDKAEKMPTEN